MSNNQPQTNQKNDQSTKPVIANDQSADAAKKAEASKTAAAPAMKPAVAGKSSNA